jgi:hypothetical protein
MSDSPQAELSNLRPSISRKWRWAAAVAGLFPALASACGAASLGPLLRSAAAGGPGAVALGCVAIHRYVIAAGALATGIALGLTLLFFRRSLAASHVPDLPYSIAVVVLALLPLAGLWQAESFLFSVIFAGWGLPDIGSTAEAGARQGALVIATLLVSVIGAACLLITPVLLAALSIRPAQHGAPRTLALVWLIATLLFGAATTSYSLRSARLRSQVAAGTIAPVADPR